jgi:hypothetical protein
MLLPTVGFLGDVERYFVALDETRAHLERLGIPAERITVSGIALLELPSRPRPW